MPAAEMLGRRWSFATDDVPMLGLFPTMLHGFWALVLIIVWIIFGKHQDCYDNTTYTVVLAGLLSTFTMFFAIGCWTIHEGLKGMHSCVNSAPDLPHPACLHHASLLHIAGKAIAGIAVSKMAFRKVLAIQIRSTDVDLPRSNDA